MKTIRFSVAILLMFSAVATIAQSTFVLERIETGSGSRIPAAIIKAETRLKVGRSYTIEQFDQALYRIRRLPFVAYATYSLEPGAAPSSRVLHLNVIDEYRVSYTVDVAGEKGGGPTGGGGSVAGDGGLGYRIFPGATGVLDLNAGSGDLASGGQHLNSSTVSARYTLYDFFGSRAYASVQVAKDVMSGRSETNTSPVLLVGLPLTQTQTILTTYSRTASSDRASVPGLSDPVISSDRISSVDVAWLYETTDDPFFARRGWLVATGPRWQRETPVSWTITGFPHPVVHYEPASLNERMFDLAASAYWPLREHASVWGRVTASQTHTTGTTPVGAYPTTDSSSEQIIAGYAYNFDGSLGSGDLGRNRLEAGFGYEGTRFRNRFRTVTTTGTAANIGYAHRSSLGVFHLTLTYLSD